MRPRFYREILVKKKEILPELFWNFSNIGTSIKITCLRCGADLGRSRFVISETLEIFPKKSDVIYETLTAWNHIISKLRKEKIQFDSRNSFSFVFAFLGFLGSKNENNRSCWIISIRSPHIEGKPKSAIGIEFPWSCNWMFSGNFFRNTSRSRAVYFEESISLTTRWFRSLH